MSSKLLGGLTGGGFRVLACADTGARTPLGVRQYFLFFSLLIPLLFSDFYLTYGAVCAGSHMIVELKSVKKNYWAPTTPLGMRHF